MQVDPELRIGQGRPGQQRAGAAVQGAKALRITAREDAEIVLVDTMCVQARPPATEKARSRPNRQPGEMLGRAQCVPATRRLRAPRVVAIQW